MLPATISAGVLRNLTARVRSGWELPALVRLASRLGADRVKAYHLFAFDEELQEQSLMGDLERYEHHILPQALELGHTLGIDLQLAEPSGGDPASLSPRTCFLPWHETWVDFDGTVLTCHSHEGQAAGTVQDFAAAWNGPLYQQVRAGLSVGCPVGACSGCGMNYAKSAEHVPVPFDPASFRGAKNDSAPIRWSGRMLQFDLGGRREWRR